MEETLVAETEVDILRRVLEADEQAGLSPEAARYVLTLQFKARDHRRIEDLAKKSNQGKLTDKERSELERYNRVRLFLIYLKSKARQALHDLRTERDTDLSDLPIAIQREVRRRAGDVCEYCHMPQAVDEAALQIDHIFARQHRGTDDLANLALACIGCNLSKGPNLAGIDPVTGQIVPLFHPRRDAWDEHFQWSGALLIGLTAAGRATIDVLAINDSANVMAREALIEEGRFPPPPAG